jgi:CPA1 family monovalent cation:H+ antiporter
VSVLLVTLLIPGFTLPALVTRLGLADDADAEEAAEKAVSRRASRAVLERLTARIDEMQARDELSEDVEAALHERIARISAVLSGESAGEEERQRLAELRHRRHLFQQVEVEALAAARAAVVAARGEPGVDPAAADRVLRRLDLRTVLLD